MLYEAMQKHSFAALTVICTFKGMYLNYTNSWVFELTKLKQRVVSYTNTRQSLLKSCYIQAIYFM